MEILMRHNACVMFQMVSDIMMVIVSAMEVVDSYQKLMNVFVME